MKEKKKNILGLKIGPESSNQLLGNLIMGGFQEIQYSKHNKRFNNVCYSSTTKS